MIYYKNDYKDNVIIKHAIYMKNCVLNNKLESDKMTNKKNDKSHEN